VRNDSPSQLGVSVWIRLMKAYNLVLRRARSSLRGGLTLPQFDVLAQLSRNPKGMTSAGLSRRLLVTAGNLTGIVDRLERERLVVREAHESDGRATCIRLTQSGRRKMAALLPGHSRDIESVFCAMPRSEMEQLRDLLGHLAHAIEGHAENAAHAGDGGHAGVGGESKEGKR